MGENGIALNANETTRPCAAALERREEEIPSHVERIYELAGAGADSTFVFTSSGAEAVNQVLWSVFLELARKEGKCHFIASALEDAPTMQMLQRLEELGCFVKIAPVDRQGQIDVEKLAELISPRTALISVTMAQGLTGVIQPVEEIARIAKEKGVLLHLDATYAIGKYYFSFDADYLTFSGDRIHSVTGSGALFAKKGVPLVPLILGGSGLRGGPLDVASLSALCSAAQQSLLFLDAMSLETARLRDAFEKEILARVPDAKPLFQEALKLPNTTAIVFPRVHHEALHYLLQRKGLQAQIGGTYCQHLHRLTGEECALSFSLSRMTTEEEVKRGASLIAEVVAQLRAVSAGVFDAV